MTGQTTTATHTWRQVIALLVQAADRGYREATTNPALHSTALWADNLASAAIALLPPEVDDLLDEVVLDGQTESLGMAVLIWAADAATRRHPIEELPVGASGVIVDLRDLAREATQ
jgi:hypothetical protein